MLQSLKCKEQKSHTSLWLIYKLSVMKNSYSVKVLKLTLLPQVRILNSGSSYVTMAVLQILASL